jgi:type I restriction enzyme S subunit
VRKTVDNEQLKDNREWKETEIGRIPADWDIDFLKNQSEIIMGQSPSSKYYNYEGKGLAFMQGRTTFGDKYHTIDTWCTDPKRIAKKNSVLMSVRAPVGDLNIAIKELCIGRGLCSLNMKNNNNEFLYYLMKAYQDQIINKETGTVFGSINKTGIENLKLPFPPLYEQQKIASILKSLDDKIELNNQMNQTLEEMAQSILKEWFVEFNFPNEEGVPYKDNGGEMVESSIGEIPEGWRVGTLEEAVELIIDHRGKTPKKLGGDWVEKGIQAISAKHIKNLNIVNPDGMNQADEKMYEKWMKEKLKAKDILMTSEAPLGELYFLAEKKDYILSQRIYGMRADEKIILPEILFYFLQSELTMGDILSRATGSTVQGIKQTELRKVKILIPQIKVQEEAVKTLRNILMRNFKNKEENQTLTKTRDELLPKLMSGEVRL